MVGLGPPWPTSANARSATEAIPTSSASSRRRSASFLLRRPAGGVRSARVVAFSNRLLATAGFDWGTTGPGITRGAAGGLRRKGWAVVAFQNFWAVEERAVASTAQTPYIASDMCMVRLG